MADGAHHLTMAPIRRVVLDLLTPHDPGLAAYAETAAETEGVEGVNATLLETDSEVRNLLLTVRGPAIDLPALTERLEDRGGSVHSIDEVVCGELTERVETPQG
jgi:hypothetical protein